jgi:hypothetical protein
MTIRVVSERAAMIAQSASAWRAGFTAGAAGAPGRCPAPAGSVEAWSWVSGYVEGKSKLMSHRMEGAKS